MSSSAFLSPPPEIKLVKNFTTPFKNVVATARTCYSSKGIIDDVTVDVAKYAELAQSIYAAGHHTTFQHAHFQFAMSNVSRHAVWSFFHSHPFYNSEQVSQRYVELKPENFTVPNLSGKALTVYLDTVRFAMERYKLLIELLTPACTEAYFARFPFRRRHADQYAKEIKKKAQEVARYVVPVAAFAYMYHTISGITLLRYWRMCEQLDVPAEQRFIVSRMIEELLAADESYNIILQSPLDTDAFPLPELPTRVASSFIDEFDASLGGLTSKLIDYKLRNEETLADAVREMLGATKNDLSDDDAIERVMNPAKNLIFGENLVLTTHDKISRAMVHPHYTFRKKLSHTADSQDQRHRMTPASRPILSRHITQTPDFITPTIVHHDTEAERVYNETISVLWEKINELETLGVSEENRMYLLPNAVSVRFTESTDLLNFHHKLAMRLCYNAQEEIWIASLDEAKQVRDLNPRIGKYLLPPCGLRDLAGTRPICPEGERFCGEKVWKYDLTEYSRII